MLPHFFHSGDIMPRFILFATNNQLENNNWIILYRIKVTSICLHSWTPFECKSHRLFQPSSTRAGKPSDVPSRSHLADRLNFHGQNDGMLRHPGSHHTLSGVLARWTHDERTSYVGTCWDHAGYPGAYGWHWSHIPVWTRCPSQTVHCWVTRE